MPPGRPSRKPLIRYKSFNYQADSWTTPTPDTTRPSCIAPGVLSCRWTPTAPDHIVYIVTVEDPNVYARPWKLRVDYRRQKVDEQWENAVWEGNKLGGLPQEFWGAAKK